MSVLRKGIYLAVFTLLISNLVSAAEPVQIHDAWIPEVPPFMKVMAGYFQAHNSSEQSITISKVSSPDFQNVEIHESVVRDGVARMQKQDSATIPAKSSIEFKPGGLHLMLIKSKRRLRKGHEVKLIFELSNGDSLTAMANVKPADAQSGSGDHSNHRFMRH